MRWEEGRGRGGGLVGEGMEKDDGKAIIVERNVEWRRTGEMGENENHRAQCNAILQNIDQDTVGASEQCVRVSARLRARGLCERKRKKINSFSRIVTKAATATTIFTFNSVVNSM